MRRPRRPIRPYGDEPNGSLAWLAAGVIGLAIAGLLIWAVFAKGNAAALDEQTLCERDGPDAITVVLIDATDPLSDVQRAAVGARLRRLVRDDLRRNERLSIFEISAHSDPLQPAFSMCRPASPDEVDTLTGSRRQAHERFEELFRPAVDQALARLLRASPSDQSPIMEAVQAASVEAFHAADLNATAPKRLVVVSDMLQNGPAARHYDEVPSFEHYAGQPQYRRFSSDLDGVDVRIFYLNRVDGDHVQGRSHIRFWQQWFSAQGALVDNVVPIEG